MKISGALIVAILGLQITLAGATLTFVVSMEHRITRLETQMELARK